MRKVPMSSYSSPRRIVSHSEEVSNENQRENERDRTKENQRGRKRTREDERESETEPPQAEALQPMVHRNAK